MVAPGLTKKEEDRYWLLSLIPAFGFTIPLLIQLISIMREASLTLWDYWLRWGIQFSVAMPTFLFTSFELLYYFKVRKSLKFYALRIAGRLLMILVAMFTFSISNLVSSYCVVPAVGMRYGVMVSLLLALTLLLFIAFQTRHFFKKLDQGSW